MPCGRCGGEWTGTHCADCGMTTGTPLCSRCTAEMVESKAYIGDERTEITILVCPACMGRPTPRRLR